MGCLSHAVYVLLVLVSLTSLLLLYAQVPVQYFSPCKVRCADIFSGFAEHRDVFGLIDEGFLAFGGQALGIVQRGVNVTFPDIPR